MNVDIAVFVLRVLFVAVLYGFILMVVRVILRDLRSVPETSSSPFAKGTPRLVVLDSDQDGIFQQQAFELRALTTIGRAPHSDIVFHDSYVSSEHAVMVNRDGNWLIQDLNSTNGTFVNRKPVHGEQSITHGDVIQIGGTRLKFMRS